MATSQHKRDGELSDSSFQKRCLAAAAGFLVLFSAISVRLVQVQHVQHDKWSQSLDTSRMVEMEIPAERGAIYDVRNQLLACDEEVKSVVFDNIWLNPRVSKGAEERMAKALARVEHRPWVEVMRAWSALELTQRYITWLAGLLENPLQKKRAEIVGMIMAPKRPFEDPFNFAQGETMLAKTLAAPQANDLARVLEENAVPCVQIRRVFRRVYPSARQLTSLLGLVTMQGPTHGVEYAMKDRMVGKPGWRSFEQDGRQKEVAGLRREKVEPEKGKSIRLTIDMALQELLEQTLDETGNDENRIYIPNLNARGITVILVDAKTMAIRAMASRRANMVPGDELTNPALEHAYEPGSTIKIITLAAALESGKVDINTLIDVENGIYDTDEISAISDHEEFDSLSAQDVLVHSSNIGAYKLARTVGVKYFRSTLEEFGFGARTGFETRYEATGKLRLVEEITQEELSRMSFGYSISVTPIQMVGALGAILNEGNYRRPYLVESVLGDHKEILEDLQPSSKQIISPRTARHVKEAMVQVCERGTAKKVTEDRYTWGGKTGTSRRYDKGDYAEGDYYVSFIGFMPADEPKILGIVVIDTPECDPGMAVGGKIAAPVFARIAERAMAYYDVPKIVRSGGSVPVNTTEQ